jgi:hypothetical protein
MSGKSTIRVIHKNKCSRVLTAGVCRTLLESKTGSSCDDWAFFSWQYANKKS